MTMILEKFTHTVMTLMNDLVTITVATGFLRSISKSAQRRWSASAIYENQKSSVL
jgi:hypothetical protein